MKQIDKDILILGCITVLIESTGRNIKDYIPDYNGAAIIKLAEGSKIYESDEATDQAIKELAGEYYKRVRKKFL